MALSSATRETESLIRTTKGLSQGIRIQRTNVFIEGQTVKLNVVLESREIPMTIHKCIECGDEYASLQKLTPEYA